jgi:hypothetical protein
MQLMKRMSALVDAHQEGNMTRNLLEGEVLIMSHISPSERALTSLFPLTSNYSMTQLKAYLAIPDCSGRVTAA